MTEERKMDALAKLNTVDTTKKLTAKELKDNVDETVTVETAEATLNEFCAVCNKAKEDLDACIGLDFYERGEPIYTWMVGHPAYIFDAVRIVLKKLYTDKIVVSAEENVFFTDATDMQYLYLQTAAVPIRQAANAGNADAAVDDAALIATANQLYKELQAYSAEVPHAWAKELFGGDGWKTQLAAVTALHFMGIDLATVAAPTKEPANNEEPAAEEEPKEGISAADKFVQAVFAVRGDGIRRLIRGAFVPFLSRYYTDILTSLDPVVGVLSAENTKAYSAKINVITEDGNISERSCGGMDNATQYLLSNECGVRKVYPFDACSTVKDIDEDLHSSDAICARQVWHLYHINGYYFDVSDKKWKAAEGNAQQKAGIVADSLYAHIEYEFREVLRYAATNAGKPVLGVVLRGETIKAYGAYYKNKAFPADMTGEQRNLYMRDIDALFNAYICATAGFVVLRKTPEKDGIFWIQTSLTHTVKDANDKDRDILATDTKTLDLVDKEYRAIAEASKNRSAVLSENGMVDVFVSFAGADTTIVPPSMDNAVAPFSVHSVVLVTDKMVYVKTPAFAYRPIEKYIKQGKQFDAAHILIGKTLANKDVFLDLKAADLVRLFGGSRSGKGVMTLNILAGLMMSGYYVAYGDFKPDMSAVFWSLTKQFNKKCAENGWEPVKFLSCEFFRDGDAATDSCNNSADSRFAARGAVHAPYYDSNGRSGYNSMYTKYDAATNRGNPRINEFISQLGLTETEYTEGRTACFFSVMAYLKYIQFFDCLTLLDEFKDEKTKMVMVVDEYNLFTEMTKNAVAWLCKIHRQRHAACADAKKIYDGLVKRAKGVTEEEKQKARETYDAYSRQEKYAQKLYNIFFTQAQIKSSAYTAGSFEPMWRWNNKAVNGTQTKARPLCSFIIGQGYTQVTNHLNNILQPFGRKADNGEARDELAISDMLERGTTKVNIVGRLDEQTGDDADHANLQIVHTQETDDAHNAHYICYKRADDKTEFAETGYWIQQVGSAAPQVFKSYLVLSRNDFTLTDPCNMNNTVKGEGDVGPLLARTNCLTGSGALDKKPFTAEQLQEAVNMNTETEAVNKLVIATMHDLVTTAADGSFSLSNPTEPRVGFSELMSYLAMHFKGMTENLALQKFIENYGAAYKVMWRIFSKTPLCGLRKYSCIEDYFFDYDVNSFWVNPFAPEIPPEVKEILSLRTEEDSEEDIGDVLNDAFGDDIPADGNSTNPPPAGNNTNPQPAGNSANPQPAGDAQDNFPAGDAQDVSFTDGSQSDTPAGNNVNPQLTGNNANSQPAGNSANPQPAGDDINPAVQGAGVPTPNGGYSQVMLDKAQKMQEMQQAAMVMRDNTAENSDESTKGYSAYGDSNAEPISFGKEGNSPFAVYQKEGSAINNALLRDEVTKQLVKAMSQNFGGLGAIYSFAVDNGMLVINGKKYAPKLPEDEIKLAPNGMQGDLAAGKYAVIFHFGYLRKMPNLISISIDDKCLAKFAFWRDLGVVEGNLKKLNKRLPHLEELKIGGVDYFGELSAEEERTLTKEQKNQLKAERSEKAIKGEALRNAGSNVAGFLANIMGFPTSTADEHPIAHAFGQSRFARAVRHGALGAGSIWLGSMLIGLASPWVLLGGIIGAGSFIMQSRNRDDRDNHYSGGRPDKDITPRRTKNKYNGRKRNQSNRDDYSAFHN